MLNRALVELGALIWRLGDAIARKGDRLTVWAARPPTHTSDRPEAAE